MCNNDTTIRDHCKIEHVFTIFFLHASKSKSTPTKKKHIHSFTPHASTNHCFVSYRSKGILPAPFKYTARLDTRLTNMHL